LGGRTRETDILSHFRPRGKLASRVNSHRRDRIADGIAGSPIRWRPHQLVRVRPSQLADENRTDLLISDQANCWTESTCCRGPKSTVGPSQLIDARSNRFVNAGPNELVGGGPDEPWRTERPQRAPSVSAINEPQAPARGRGASATYPKAHSPSRPTIANRRVINERQAPTSPKLQRNQPAPIANEPQAPARSRNVKHQRAPSASAGMRRVSDVLQTPTRHRKPTSPERKRAGGVENAHAFHAARRAAPHFRATTRNTAHRAVPHGCVPQRQPPQCPLRQPRRRIAAMRGQIRIGIVGFRS